MTIIVTDHHEIPYEEVESEKRYILPPADAVIDPKQQTCAYPFKELCGAGVAYKPVSYTHLVALPAETWPQGDPFYP